jgi:hypothetical protein
MAESPDEQATINPQNPAPDAPPIAIDVRSLLQPNTLMSKLC